MYSQTKISSTLLLLSILLSFLCFTNVIHADKVTVINKIDYGRMHPKYIKAHLGVLGGTVAIHNKHTLLLNLYNYRAQEKNTIVVQQGDSISIRLQTTDGYWYHTKPIKQNTQNKPSTLTIYGKYTPGYVKRDGKTVSYFYDDNGWKYSAVECSNIGIVFSIGQCAINGPNKVYGLWGGPYAGIGAGIFGGSGYFSPAIYPGQFQITELDEFIFYAIGSTDAGGLRVGNENFGGIGFGVQAIQGDFYGTFRSNYFFLSNGKYARFDPTNNKVDENDMSTSAMWPGITTTQAKKITAVLPYINGDDYFFFSDGTYSRFNPAQNKVAESGYDTAKEWSGITSEQAKMIVGVL